MLVAVAVGQVQRFVSEARKTVDLHNASRLYSDLAGQIAASLTAAGATLVFPSPGSDAAPNKVVATIGADGSAAAREAVEVAHRWWAQRVAQVLPGQTVDPPPISWVCATEGDYAAQWAAAMAALDARKRTRPFTMLHAVASRVCSTTGRYPAIDPPRRQPREREHLCAEGWFKRFAYRDETFPSTRSLAFALYRRDVFAASGDVAAALAELDTAIERVPRDVCPPLPTAYPALSAAAPVTLRRARDVDGAWYDPGHWASRDVTDAVAADVAAAGARAARTLRAAAGDDGIMFPGPYVAIVAQDVDRMGERLGRPGADAAFHQAVSAALAATAARQRDVVESLEHLGRVVYAGGDDLLALVPAGTALAVADRVRWLVDDHVAPAVGAVSASSAVVFFHTSFPLQDAIREAHHALAAAKAANRNNLAVSLIKGGTVVDRVIAPWARDGAAAALTRLTGRRLSGSALANRVGAVAAGLTSPELVRVELQRLLARHEPVADSDVAAVAADIGAVCRAGSVRNAAEVADVLHLISNLEAFGCR